jgi:hypothetical protein
LATAFDYKWPPNAKKTDLTPVMAKREAFMVCHDSNINKLPDTKLVDRLAEAITMQSKRAKRWQTSSRMETKVTRCVKAIQTIIVIREKSLRGRIF